MLENVSPLVCDLVSYSSPIDEIITLINLKSQVISQMADPF